MTHIVAVVSDAPPGSLSQHQQIHLCFHRTRAAQGLSAPVGGFSRVGVPGSQKNSLKTHCDKNSVNMFLWHFL